jgi:hypothetical protein
VVAPAVKCQRKCDRDLKAGRVPIVPQQQVTRGRVVNFENNNSIPEQQGFTTEDILWAVGIWSVILTLSPVVVFYMLMVA